MSDFFEVLKARKKRKDYLTRKPRKQYIRHADSNYYGTINQYANKYLTERLSGEKVSKERRNELFNRVKNHMLNMPHEYGLDLISYKDVPEGSLPKRKGKTYVRHADSGFEGSIGSAANRVLNQQIAASGMDVDKDTREQLRVELKNRMEANPQEYGLSVIEGAKRTDFKKPKSTKTPQAASAPPKIAPILPKETTTQQSTPDGLNMEKVMQAMKLLQTNGFPVNAESIKALLPHLPEETPQTKSPFQPFYPELTEDGRFNTTPRSSFRGSDIETPAQKEEMLQYFRDNPDERVQDRRFFQDAFDEGIEGGLDADQFLAQLLSRGGLHNRGKADKSTWKDKANRNEGKDIRGNLLDTSRAADPDKAFTEQFPSRYDEEGLAGADTRSATDDMDRPEIPDFLDPKKNKKKIENIMRQQKIYDTKGSMTEEQLMLARQKKMEADAVKARQQDATRATAMAGETKPAGQMTMDDWKQRLLTSAANPTGAPPTTLNSNFDNNMFDENGNLKEEYQ